MKPIKTATKSIHLLLERPLYAGVGHRLFDQLSPADWQQIRDAHKELEQQGTIQVSTSARSGYRRLTLSVTTVS